MGFSELRDPDSGLGFGPSPAVSGISVNLQTYNDKSLHVNKATTMCDTSSYCQGKRSLTDIVIDLPPPKTRATSKSITCDPTRCIRGRALPLLPAVEPDDTCISDRIAWVLTSRLSNHCCMLHVPRIQLKVSQAVPLDGSSNV